MGPWEACARAECADRAGLRCAHRLWSGQNHCCFSSAQRTPCSSPPVQSAICTRPAAAAEGTLASCKAPGRPRRRARFMSPWPRAGAGAHTGAACREQAQGPYLEGREGATRCDCRPSRCPRGPAARVTLLSWQGVGSQAPRRSDLVRCWCRGTAPPGLQSWAVGTPPPQGHLVAAWESKQEPFPRPRGGQTPSCPLPPWPSCSHSWALWACLLCWFAFEPGVQLLVTR